MPSVQQQKAGVVANSVAPVLVAKMAIDLLRPELLELDAIHGVAHVVVAQLGPAELDP